MLLFIAQICECPARKINHPSFPPVRGQEHDYSFLKANGVVDNPNKVLAATTECVKGAEKQHQATTQRCVKLTNVQ